MTQEEKQLLLNVMCALLPYEVKVRINTKNNYYNAIVCEITRNYICVEGGGEICFSHGTYKPYLRPMSSMTEEEQKEFVQFHCVRLYPIVITEMLTLENESNMFDWLNKKMFDYRGLIPMGLGIEAPKDMYNTKTEL